RAAANCWPYEKAPYNSQHPNVGEPSAPAKHDVYRLRKRLLAFLGSGFGESYEAILKSKPHLFLDEDETTRTSFRRHRRDYSSLRPRSDHALWEGKAVT